MKISSAINSFRPYQLEKSDRVKKEEADKSEGTPHVSTLSSPESHYLGRVLGQNVSLGDFLESIKQDLSAAAQSNPPLSARY